MIAKLKILSCGLRISILVDLIEFPSHPGLRFLTLLIPISVVLCMCLFRHRWLQTAVVILTQSVAVKFSKMFCP
jgi:flagellar biosynthesis protein FlhB